jgi:CHAT domain-containing protein
LLQVMDFQNVEQLTLSACDTATGGGINENGAEVEGLAAVVLRQRAQAVLATLWKVEDASTAQLMRDFYATRSARSPLTRAQALRQAQLLMLRGTPAPSTPALGNAEPRTGVNWRHPFYWAPFVLSGNWL